MIWMYTFTFEYRDAYTHGEWRQQSCSADNEREVIEWYGLGIDCEYRNLKQVKDDGTTNHL